MTAFVFKGATPPFFAKKKAPRGAPVVCSEMNQNLKVVLTSPPRLSEPSTDASPSAS